MITKHYVIMSVCISGFSGKLADFIIFGSTTPRRNVAGSWESSAPKQEATFHSILTPHRKEVSSSILSNCETFLLRLVMEGNRIEPSSSWGHGYWIIPEYKMNWNKARRTSKAFLSDAYAFCTWTNSSKASWKLLQYFPSSVHVNLKSI